MERSRRNQNAPRPKTNNNSVLMMDPDLQEGMGNAAMQEQLRGPSGRIFSNIVEGSGKKATPEATFTEGHLKQYLEHQLDFADGEFFRGTKLKGAAEAMFGELDSNRDGVVGWMEFSGINSQLAQLLVPIAGEEDFSAEHVAEIAARQFDSVAGSRNGLLNLDELKSDALKKLPDDTEHKDLVAQLAARLAIDAIDRDQGDVAVHERQISRGEWIRTAVELMRK